MDIRIRVAAVAVRLTAQNPEHLSGVLAVGTAIRFKASAHFTPSFISACSLS